MSRLFDVAEGSTLEESSSSAIRLEWNKGIVGHVAATGQPLNIRNAYEVSGPVGPSLSSWGLSSPTSISTVLTLFWLSLGGVTV